MSTDYAAVLTYKYQGRQWKLEGDNYEGLVMLDGGPMPSKKDLDDAWPEVAAKIAAQTNEANAAKISAYAKLKALGLTEAEIAALVG